MPDASVVRQPRTSPSPTATSPNAVSCANRWLWGMTVFAQLTAFGEVAVGLGLVLGCLTTLASGIGLVLVLNYGLAVQWQGSAQQGFHYMLITSLVVVLATRAGRTWGLDGWARARRPGSWLARVPLG